MPRPRRLAGTIAILCGLILGGRATPADAGLILAGGAVGPSTIVDTPISFHSFVASLASGPLFTAASRDVFRGTLTMSYWFSTPLLAALLPGDSLAISGFGGPGGTVAASYAFATPPYGGTTSALPPIPFARMASGDTLTLGDWGRIYPPDAAGTIAVPLQVRLFTDATAYGMGEARWMRGGEAIGTFDVLVPVAAPEPGGVAMMAGGAVVGLGVWVRAARRRERGMIGGRPMA